MDAEPEFVEEGLVIYTLTNRHGSSNIISKKNGAHVKSIHAILMEQEMAPLSVLPTRVATLAPFVPATMPMASLTVTQTASTSTALGDNRHRVMHDSEGQRNSSRASLPCTNNTRLSNRTYRLTDLCQLPSLIEAEDEHIRSKFVNIEQSNENQTPSRRDVYYNELVAPAQAGNLQNWSRVVKPEASFTLEESWPPLLPSTRKEEPSKKTSCVVKSAVNAQRQLEDSLCYSSCPNMGNQFRPNSTPLHGSREVVLDEHSWPSLEKFNRRSVLHHDYGIDKKRRTLQPLGHRNIGTAQDQKRTAHGGLYKMQNVHFPPILLMVNKDFIVTSPLKENLLLTLALMGRRPTPDAHEDVNAQFPEGTEAKRQILVGQFKAFSSFLHFMLGHDATRVRLESNAGGTSTISESLSVEYFVRRFQAKDIVTEMEVEYCSFNWKKVDYICTLYGQRVGISVTRAMSFPDPKDFSVQMAYRLLHKKLFGLVVARHGVSKRHSFSQCILHVWCETQQTASLMQREYDAVSRVLDIADDVVMVLTVADGYHARPIFYESLLRNESK